MDFLSTLLKIILTKSLVIEIISTSLVANKLEIRIFLSKNDEIGPEKYFWMIMRSLKISDDFKFRTQKILDVFNFGQNFFRNLKRPKFMVLDVCP